MPSARGLWTRWKRVAHRAAEIQAHVVFFSLYFLAIVPMGLLHPGGRTALRRGARGVAPQWRARESPANDLDASRRQF